MHVSTGSLSGEGGEFILPDRSVRGILLYYENYFTLKLRRIKKLLFRMLLRNDACISAELALSLEYRYYYSFTSSYRHYDNEKTTMLILSGCHTLCRNLQGRGLCKHNICRRSGLHGPNGIPLMSVSASVCQWTHTAVFSFVDVTVP